MKTSIKILLGSFLYCQNAFALPNDTHIDIKTTGVDYSSESSIYYSGKEVKTEENKKTMIKGKVSPNQKVTTRIFNGTTKNYYFSMDNQKSFMLFKGTEAKNADILTAIPPLMSYKFSNFNNLTDLQKSLGNKGFVSKGEAKIKVANKSFDCLVYESLLKDQFKTKEGKSYGSISKIWISKELAFPLKMVYMKDNGQKLISEEVTNVMNNVKFDKNFFVPSDKAKIEDTKESYGKPLSHNK